MGWEAHFDNTNWSAVVGSWSGTKWEPDMLGGLTLNRTGTWTEDYRPTKIRVTFEGGGAVIMKLEDNQTPEHEIAANASYSSTGEENLTFDGTGTEYDIMSYTQLGAGANVTNIEFFVGLYEAEITEGVGLGETLDGQNLDGKITGAAGLGETLDGFPLADQLADGAGLGDAFDRYFETEKTITEEAGLGDAFEGFNWSAWLRANLEKAVPRFYFTLTGAEDGEEDAEIPISSFQGRFRDGEPSYLAVVIPTLDYADQINARPNGQLVVEMAYLVDGEESVREEVCRVDFEEIRSDEGGRSESVTLSGHRTETWAGQSVTLTGISYKSVSGGKIRVRCFPDLYLRPGDTVTAGEDEFTAGLVTYAVTASRHRLYASMEVKEA